MVILDHIADTQVFHGQVVVVGKRPMTQLVEKIAALVGNTLMLALQDDDGLPTIVPALPPSSHTALGDMQAPLGSAVPGRMLDVFPRAGGDERGQPDINADIDASRRHRLWRNFTGTHRIPLAGLAGESECLDRSWHLTMPAHSQTANASNFEAATIHFEPIAVLLEAKTVEPMLPFEPWIAGFFSGFDAAKKRLKRFIQILHDGLQHMTMDRASVGVGRFVGLDLAQLFVLAYPTLFVRVGVFALGKTAVVPMATGLEGPVESTVLTVRGIETIDHGFAHSARVPSERQ